MKPTLLILAAGMGSRYGGLKQLDPMGPNGETVLDYSVYDAIRAGFGKVVFVIRRDFEDSFKAAIGDKLSDQIEVSYVYQELTDLPEGFELPANRQKPWGTAHALRAARSVVNEPFAVINADDFYGQNAYEAIVNHFKEASNIGKMEVCMVGYKLMNTLSNHGSVNRGLCSTDIQGNLTTVEEHHNIAQDKAGCIHGENLSGKIVELSADCIVSMNFWGFTPQIFSHLETAFRNFLRTKGQELKSECYIPTVIDNLLRSKEVQCRVIENSGEWFGVTYPQDKDSVQANIRNLITKGQYPQFL